MFLFLQKKEELNKQSKEIKWVANGQTFEISYMFVIYELGHHYWIYSSYTITKKTRLPQIDSKYANSNHLRPIYLQLWLPKLVSSVIQIVSNWPKSSFNKEWTEREWMKWMIYISICTFKKKMLFQLIQLFMILFIIIIITSIAIKYLFIYTRKY